MTKLRFMIGLAQKHERDDRQRRAAAGADHDGRACVASCRSTRSMLLAHETAAPIENGVLWPSKTILYAAMALQSEFNGRMLESDPRDGRRGFHHAAVVGGRFRQSGNRRRHRALHALGDSDARTRIELMRLIWDFLGSEFGSRHAAIREILRRRLVPGEAECLPQLRLQARHRAGRQGAEFAAGGMTLFPPLRSGGGAARSARMGARGLLGTGRTRKRGTLCASQPPPPPKRAVPLPRFAGAEKENKLAHRASVTCFTLPRSRPCYCRPIWRGTIRS